MLKTLKNKPFFTLYIVRTGALLKKNNNMEGYNNNNNNSSLIAKKSVEVNK